MSQQIINISTPDDGLGDVLRNGFNKTNQNFTELYNGKVDKITGKGLSKNDFTDADKTKLDGIEAGAEVNVQSDWGETDPLVDSFILNKPPSLYSAFGYFHYSDLATQTTPLVVLPSVPKKLTNDTLGTFTNRDQAPYGISGVWNTSTNALDFSQLSVGDGVLIRTDLSISTTSINQKLQLYIKFGIGTPSEYDLLIDSWYERSVITFKHFLKDVSFSIDNEDWRTAPADIYILSDDDGSVKVNGWYIPIIRKSINIVDFDDSLLVKKSDFQTAENTQSGTDVIVSLPLNGASYINFTNPLLESISGVSFLVPVDEAYEPPYPGKPFIFKNLTGNPITIKNNQSVFLNERPFLTKDGLDITIPNGEHIRFNYGVKLGDSFRSWGDISGKLDKVSTAGVERVYTINPDGSQATKPTSDFGGSQLLFTHFGTLNMSVANQWYTSWRANGDRPNFIFNTNSIFGTGIIPSSQGLSNTINLTKATKVNKIDLFYHINSGTANLQLYIVVSDLNGSNQQVLVDEVLATNTATGIFHKNLNVAINILNPNTILRCFIRNVGGTFMAYDLQLIFEFE